MAAATTLSPAPPLKPPSLQMPALQQQHLVMSSGITTSSSNSLQAVLLQDQSSSSSAECYWRSTGEERRRSMRMVRKRRKNRGSLHHDDDDVQWQWSATATPDNLKYLTFEQEAELCHYIQEENARTETMSSSNCRAVASMKHARSCNKDKMMLRARQSKERILLSYKRFVISVASSHLGRGLPLEDLIQEGCIGLLRGVQKFDKRKGYRLSTYVYWWIRQAIVRAINLKFRLVRLPGSLCEATNKSTEAKSPLKNYNKGMMTLQLAFPGPDEIGPEPTVTRGIMLLQLKQHLNSLNEREELVIRLYYGLDGERLHTFEEIGRQMKLSRERARQIHMTALERLRQEKNSLECLWQSFV